VAEYREAKKNNFSNVWIKYLDLFIQGKIPLPIFFIISIASCLTLFLNSVLPNDLLKQLGFSGFFEKYGIYIGVIFILSFATIIVTLITRIISKFCEIRKEGKNKYI